MPAKEAAVLFVVVLVAVVVVVATVVLLLILVWMPAYAPEVHDVTGTSLYRSQKWRRYADGNTDVSRAKDQAYE